MLVPGPEDQRVRITIEQAEAEHPGKTHFKRWDDEARREQLRKPFGYNNAQWEELKALMQPGDELWEVCTSKKLWDDLMGYHHYELCRDGVILATVVMRMN